MTSLFSLSYISHSCLDDLVLDTRVEIDKILEVAQSRNAAADITGALMFNEHMFTQVLEGNEGDVRAIFSSIERDPRHREIAVVATNQIAHRSFASWRMVYAGTSDAAKVYYKDYVAGREDWNALTGPQISEILLRMISLDQGSRETIARKSPPT